MSHTKFNLMAVPCDRAFVISEQDAGLLSQKNAGAPVSYTHLDVYKRQPMAQSSHSTRLFRMILSSMRSESS